MDYRQNSKTVAILASFCSQLNNEILEDFLSFSLQDTINSESTSTNKLEFSHFCSNFDKIVEIVEDVDLYLILSFATKQLQWSWTAYQSIHPNKAETGRWGHK